MQEPNEAIRRYIRRQFRAEATSLRQLFICKSVIVVKSIGDRLQHGRLRKIGRERMMKMRETRAENAFVFANGPSINDLDFGKIKRLVDSKTFDLIGVNSFASGAVEKHAIVPTALALCDPMHYAGTDKGHLLSQVEEDIRVINRHRIPVFVPSRYYSRSEFVNTIPFCGVFNPYGSNVTDIQRPLGFNGVTAFLAIAAAIDLGYRNIYLCGFDNSYFKQFEVDRENRKYFLDAHFYDPATVSKRYLPTERYGPASHIFTDISRHFRFLEKINKLKPPEVRIRNIALVTYTDAFERCFELDVYKDGSELKS